MPRGDSVEALRAIWMEGYMRGRADGQDAVRTGAPVPIRSAEVEITPEDIGRVYEKGACGNAECPACGAAGSGEGRQ